MAPLNRIIIDTDPGKLKTSPSPSHTYNTSQQSLTCSIGVDDVLAMLLALAANPEEIEVLLLSITYGNVPVQRHVLSLILSIQPC